MPRYVIPIMLALTAAVIRIIYIAEFSLTPLFDPQAMGADAAVYDSMARAIADGHVMGSGVFGVMPLFGYLLGIIYAVFGHSLIAAYGLQILLGSASVALVYELGHRLAGNRVGLIAGCIATVADPLVFHTGMLTGDTLAVFLVLLLLVIVHEAVSRQNIPLLFAAGITAGFGVLTRGTFAIFIVLFVVWHVLPWGNIDRHTPFRRRLAGTALIIMGMMLIILPVTIRNYVAGGDIVLVSSHDGMSMYLGNNPRARGAYQPLPEWGDDPYEMRRSARLIAEREMNRELKPSEISAYWRGRSLNFVRDQPLPALRLAIEKMWVFANRQGVSDVASPAMMKRFARVLAYGTIPLGVVMPFALFGLMVTMRRRVFAPMALFVAANAIAVVITFVNERYRLTAVPVFAVYTAVSIDWLLAHIRSWRHVTAGLACVGACTFVVYRPLIIGADPAMEALKIAGAFYYVGDTTAAEREFRRVLVLDAQSQAAHYGLGLIHWQAGHIDDAEDAAKAAVEIEPGHVDALNLLGNISGYIEEIGSAHFHTGNVRLPCGLISRTCVRRSRSTICRDGYHGGARDGV